MTHIDTIENESMYMLTDLNTGETWQSISKVFLEYMATKYDLSDYTIKEVKE